MGGASIGWVAGQWTSPAARCKIRAAATPSSAAFRAWDAHGAGALGFVALGFSTSQLGPFALPLLLSLPLVHDCTGRDLGMLRRRQVGQCGSGSHSWFSSSGSSSSCSQTSIAEYVNVADHVIIMKPVSPWSGATILAMPWGSTLVMPRVE